MTKKLLFILILFSFYPLASSFADALKNMAKKISDSAQSLQNKKIVVLPFLDDRGSESSGSVFISERWRAHLLSQKKIEVIEPFLLEKALKDLHVQSLNELDLLTAKQLGEMLGAKGIVNGVLIDLNSKKIEVNARLLNAETGEILGFAQGVIEKKGEESFFSKKLLSSQIVELSTPPAPLHSVLELDPHCGECSVPSLLSSSVLLSPENAAVRVHGLGNNNFIKKDFFEDWGSDLSFILMDCGWNSNEIESSDGKQLLQGFQFLQSFQSKAALEHFGQMNDRLNKNQNEKILSAVYLGYGLSLIQAGQKNKGQRWIRRVSKKSNLVENRAVAIFILGKLAEQNSQSDQAKLYYFETLRLLPFQTSLVLRIRKRLVRL